MTTFINPYTYISDPTRGRPVFNGRVFLGNPDTDPVQPENQIPVSVVNENGTLTQVPQPIRTGPGGVATFQGNPVQLDVDLVQHSMTIQDANGRQVYYSPRISIVGGANVPTDIIQQFQQFGTPRFITSAANMGNPFPYARDARVVYNAGAGDNVYESQTNNNTTLPTDTNNWRVVDSRAIDAFNDLRYLNEVNNLGDLPSPAAARDNLFLGDVARFNIGQVDGRVPVIGDPSLDNRSAVIVNAGTNGNGSFRVWSDGIIEQFSPASIPSGARTVTLPTAFPNINYWPFLVTVENNTADRISTKLRSKAVSSFVVSTDSATSVAWYARNG